MAFSSELGEQFILFHNSYCLGLQMNSRKITYLYHKDAHLLSPAIRYLG